MRDDMFKVIVERPRWGASHAASPKLKRLAYADAQHIGLKRHAPIGARYTKGLNENLATLLRYLRRQRGRRWDAAFSEICASLDTGSTVKMHVRQHIEDFVLTRISIGRRGDASAFAARRIGTIEWIGNSPFRAGHRRRNWFVGVALAPEPDAVPNLKDADIDYQAMRASGPGGQHVNKADSAVRATHQPTGLVATAQEQRSQHANRKLARLKLAIMLEERRGQAKMMRANRDGRSIKIWNVATRSGSMPERNLS